MSACRLRICLGGLAAGRTSSTLARDLALLHPKNDTFTGEVLLELAADALEEAGERSDDPIAENIRERFRPECSFEADTITGQAALYALVICLVALATVRVVVPPR